MLDRGRFWTPAPAEGEASFVARGVTIKPIGGLRQTLASGALGEAARLCGVEPPVGFAGVASGPAYAVSVARDRMLVVSNAALPLADGWNAASGVAATPIDDGLLVLEIRGPGLPELLSKATPLAPDDPTPSAALLFAGLPALAYRYGGADVLRLHVDRSLASALVEWLRLA